MRATLACTFVLAVHLHAVAQPPSSGSPLTPAAFASELDRLITALEVATPADGAALGATVPLRWRVETGGAEIEVEGTWLIHELREAATRAGVWSDRRPRLVSRLRDLRAHAVELAETTHPDSVQHEARAALTGVLARPEFQRSASAQWLERLRQQVGEWLRAMFQRLGVGGMAGRDAAMMLAWIAGLAAFAGLAIYVARLLTAPARAITLSVPAGSERRVSAREWALRAGAAARQGNTREAIRCAYRSAIRRLDEQGAWRVDHARTPREYLRLLGVDDTRRSPVKELTEQFEQAWYGNRVVSADDVRRAGASLEKLGCLSAADRAM